jgi:putative heme-binding domain-containing protein
MSRLESRRREPLTAEERNLRTNEEVREFTLSDAAEGGMAELGEDLFNYLCLTCHAKGSAGSRRGPNLDTVRAASPELLIDSILQPNLKVDEQYRSRHVTLKNGDIVTGTLLEETSGTLTIAGEGEPVKIGRSDIERITVTDTSAMPENLLNALTWDEIRDLWAYLILQR